MDKKQTILSFINKNGPTFPGQLYSELGVNLLIASAYMSEMSRNGDLNISKVKVGGSPLYYIKGQENLLEGFIDKLHEKEKKAALFLKEKRVLRDSSLEPLLRVSLRQTKDFAKPFYVKVNNKKEIFWKWYLLKDQIFLKKKVLSLINKQNIQHSPHNLTKECLSNSSNFSNLDNLGALNIHKSGNLNKKENKKENNGQTNKQPSQTNNLEETSNLNNSKIQKGEKNKLVGHVSFSHSKNLNFQDKTIKLIEQELMKGNIRILDLETIKKSKDYNLTLIFHSPLGKLKYYCKFWNKKKINDKDIDSLFVIGQMKKLPIVLISTGDLTKKAQFKLDEEMQGIKFKKIRL